MKLFCLLWFVVPLVTAKVFPRTGVNDVFDGVEGVMYDIPEYEDPAVSLFKLIAKGIMPVYTIRSQIQNSKDLSSEDDKSHFQTDDIKKGLDAVIVQLQEAKSKLENGYNGIYLYIDKAVLYLENLKHRLYLDVHTTDSSKKELATSAIETIDSSGKASTGKYSDLRASLKRFLSSDDPIYKYFSSDDPMRKYFSFDLPTEKILQYHKSDEGDLAFNSDTALVPYSAPNVSGEKSPVDGISDDNKQSDDSTFSKDQNLHSESPQILMFGVSTEQPFVFDKDIYKYELLKTELPPVEDSSDEEKEVKASMADGVVSSGEADKIEQGDKTLIHKKFTWKLSSTV